MQFVGAGARREDLNPTAGASVLGVEICAQETTLADLLDRGPSTSRDNAPALDASRGNAVNQHLLRTARRSADLRVPGISGHARCEKDELFQVAYIPAYK